MPHDNDDTEYGLVLPFDDESESFALGFEAGGIYNKMQAGELLLEGPVHAANHNLILRMAGKEGYACTLTPSGVDGWLSMRAQRLRGPDDTRAN